MAFIQSRKGPRKSVILASLGPEYFGITQEQLDLDVQLAAEDEAAGIIDQPNVEEGTGRLFLLFNAPGGGAQKFYLEEAGYRLLGHASEKPQE
jgi:hypothetical protein